MSFKALFLVFSLVLATPIAHAEVSITHNGELYFELGNDGVLKAKDLCRKRTVVVMEGVKEQHIVKNQVFAVDQKDQLQHVGSIMTKVPRSESRKSDERTFGAVAGLFSYALMASNTTAMSVPLAVAAACTTYVVLSNQDRAREVKFNSIDHLLTSNGIDGKVESFEIQKEDGVTKDIVLNTSKGVYLVSELIHEPSCESQLVWPFPY